MHSRFVRFLLIFAALWLPVQTVAAMSMQLCRHMTDESVIQADVAVAAAPCHEASQAQDQHHAMGAEASAHGDACDNCEMCQLACAGFMPSADQAAKLIDMARSYAVLPVATPPSHIVEPPQHPPRSGA